MKRISIILFVLSLYIFRLTQSNILPPGYRDGDTLVYELTLLDTPTQVGQKLKYQIGHTTLVWDHYFPLELGSRYRITGALLPKSQFDQIIALDFAVSQTKLLSTNPMLNLGELLLVQLATLRNHLTSLLARNLPEPESSLAAGILLGVKRDLSYDFRNSLIESGTLHTVAASGYNVNLVARYLLSFTSQFLPHTVALSTAALGIILFCLLSGSSAAVVRAGIMGLVMLLGTGLGRQKDAKRIFIFASYSMLIYDPLYLFDVGYQLSVASTAGILYLEPILSKLIKLPPRFVAINTVLHNYWWPTLAATIATTPISLFTFGQSSWVGPFANLFILPTIPLIMSLTALFLTTATIIPPLTPLIAAFLYLPLTYFVRLVIFFGSL